MNRETVKGTDFSGGSAKLYAELQRNAHTMGFQELEVLGIGVSLSALIWKCSGLSWDR